jgi:hypothetical protein
MNGTGTDVYPGTADLIELLEILDRDGRARGPLCKYAQIACDRGFILVLGAEPDALDERLLFRARLVAAEVTDEGRTWIDQVLGPATGDGAVERRY